MGLREKMLIVLSWCEEIDDMRNDRSSNVNELNNLYERTVKVIIDIMPDIALNKWLDGDADDIELMCCLNINRSYAENFIEETIKRLRGMA